MKKFFLLLIILLCSVSAVYGGTEIRPGKFLEYFSINGSMINASLKYDASTKEYQALPPSYKVDGGYLISDINVNCSNKTSIVNHKIYDAYGNFTRNFTIDSSNYPEYSTSTANLFCSMKAMNAN